MFPPPNDPSATGQLPKAQDFIRNLVDNMKPNGNLIIMDTVLQWPGSVPTATEVALRVRDLSMMQVRSGKERELDEWVALLKDADERLRLRNVVQPFGSLMSVSEVVRENVRRSDDYITGQPNDNMYA